MDDESRTIDIRVSPEELKLIKAGLDLLLMTEDDREAITELKELLQRLRERSAVSIS